MKKTTVFMGLFLVLAGFSLTADAAGAGINGADLLDNLLLRFHNTSSLWGKKMVAYASWLFWGLTLLSMVWTYGMMALRKADFQEFFAETVGFFAVTGFFFWILENGPQIAIAIIDSLRQIASDASGLSKTLSPSGIVDIGFDIAAKVIDASSIWSPATSIVGLFIAVVILIVLALIGINMLMVLISAWVLAYGAVFILGFGGGRWTQDLAIHYYRTVLGMGLQIFAMILIIGIGKSFIDQYYTAMSGDMSLKELLVMLVAAIILLSLVRTIPPLLAGLVQGGGFHGGGGAGLGGVMAAGGLAGTALSSVASTVSNAGTSLAGSTSALMTAFKAAQQTMGEGNTSAPSSSPSLGGLAQAMGDAGRFAQSMGSHLAYGVKETARDKLDNVKEAFEARVSQTMGGQVAEAIHERMEKTAPFGEASAAADGLDNITPFHVHEGSLAKGHALTPDEEVASFVHNATGTGD